MNATVGEIWDDAGNSPEYLCTAKTIYYSYKPWMTAKRNGLVNSLLWGGGAWTLFVSLVVIQSVSEALKILWSFSISFTFSVRKLYIQFMSWHLLGIKVHLTNREHLGEVILTKLIPFLNKAPFVSQTFTQLRKSLKLWLAMMLCYFLQWCHSNFCAL